jgi:glucose/arabinose dehydrogenase
MRIEAKHSLTGRLTVAVLLSALVVNGSAVADNLPAGFQETAVFGGATFSEASAMRMAPDGRVFVAERGGTIKIFDDVDDATPTIFADLRTNVYNAWDRGLLGLALHPQFPAAPYVYVLYTHDATVGGSAPLWNDQCPDPPGFTNEGCVVSSRLSRLEAAGDVMTGSELVLIEGWCQQFPSHSVGDLRFGSDGALYLSHGDGASFNFPDFGQVGNPCGDPPGEGGALRSQDLQTAGDPVNLHGSILRLDPLTGTALPDNPLFGGAESGDDRIIAYGLRNPFRFTIRPQSDELWISDVGWGGWEEINRIIDPTDALVENFGWPCYEGFAPQPGYDAVDLPICENLYAGGTVAPPHHAYAHGNPSGSAITGLAFYEGGSYPAQYDGALFFADYSEAWIRVMFPGPGGDPDPANIALFATNITPVDLQIGPDGDLFYVNYQVGGPSDVRRVQYFPVNQPPVAILQANPTNGPAPLTVNFDGSSSYDPDPNGTITFDWDLDGDGAFGDANAPALQHTYVVGGNRLARMRVTDNLGASTTAFVLISADNAPPASVWLVTGSITL